MAIQTSKATQASLFFSPKRAMPSAPFCITTADLIWSGMSTEQASPSRVTRRWLVESCVRFRNVTLKHHRFQGGYFEARRVKSYGRKKLWSLAVVENDVAFDGFCCRDFAQKKNGAGVKRPIYSFDKRV